MQGGPALNPREIVDVKDEPIIDPVTKIGTRIDPTTQQISEPMRRAVTYRDGSVEYFEWDKRGEQPPGPVPWGRQLPTVGTNQPYQNDWERLQKEAAAAALAGPGIHPAGPLGSVTWDPVKKQYVPISGTAPREPREPISSSGGEFWRYNEATGQMEMVGASPSALADRQAAAQERVAAAQRAVEAQRTQQLQLQMNAIKMAQDAGEIDAKRAAELRDYAWKTQVEYPEKLRQQEDVLRGNALTYGTQAGAAAVSDVTAMLPYRYSPGFGERRSAALEAAGRGDYRPQPIARGYVGPDLRATRQGAESQYRNQYLQQFGFDPQVVANQVAYRQPGVGVAASPAGGSVAPAPAPSSDDEEYLKQLAQQLAGG